ncbi:MAG: DUF262 domain-containing protein [Lactococcus sp.]
MKINYEKLQSGINNDPTKRTTTENIQGLARRIDDGTLTLPIFQRGLSWTNKKAVSLFNYQLYGKAPVSPLSFNEINKNNNVTQLSFINRQVISEEANLKGNWSVVDGQQRLTTNYLAYSGNERFSNIVLDLKKGDFLEIINTPTSYQIPVTILLFREQQVLIQYLNKTLKPEEAMDLYPILLGVRQSLLGYKYTLHIADDMIEDEQIEWFEVLNNAGSRISASEMSMSKLKLNDFDLRYEFVLPYQKIVTKYSFDSLFKPFSSKVSYPIASMNPGIEVHTQNGIHTKNYAPITSDKKLTMLQKLSREQLMIIKDTTLNALEKSFAFVQSNGLSAYIDRMDYIMYLTGYFVFNEHSTKNNELADWVKNVVFVNATNGQKREIFDKLIKEKW